MLLSFILVHHCDSTNNSKIVFDIGSNATIDRVAVSDDDGVEGFFEFTQVDESVQVKVFLPREDFRTIALITPNATNATSQQLLSLRITNNTSKTRTANPPYMRSLQDVTTGSLFIYVSECFRNVDPIVMDAQVTYEDQSFPVTPVRYSEGNYKIQFALQRPTTSTEFLEDVCTVVDGTAAGCDFVKSKYRWIS